MCVFCVWGGLGDWGLWVVVVVVGLWGVFFLLRAEDGMRVECVSGVETGARPVYGMGGVTLMGWGASDGWSVGWGKGGDRGGRRISKKEVGCRVTDRAQTAKSGSEGLVTTVCHRVV